MRSFSGRGQSDRLGAVDIVCNRRCHFCTVCIIINLGEFLFFRLIGHAGGGQVQGLPHSSFDGGGWGQLAWIPVVLFFICPTQADCTRE